jgi:hypothetical protein
MFDEYNNLPKGLRENLSFYPFFFKTTVKDWQDFIDGDKSKLKTFDIFGGNYNEKTNKIDYVHNGEIRVNSNDVKSIISWLTEKEAKKGELDNILEKHLKRFLNHLDANGKMDEETLSIIVSIFEDLKSYFEEKNVHLERINYNIVGILKPIFLYEDLDIKTRNFLLKILQSKNLNHGNLARHVNMYGIDTITIFKLLLGEKVNVRDGFFENLYAQIFRGESDPEICAFRDFLTKCSIRAQKCSSA